MGNALLAQGRMAEAISHYERTLALDPDQPATHNTVGLALASLDRIEEAISHYERALVLHPDHVQANSNLGVLRTRQGRHADAVGHYQRVLAIQPEHADVHNNLAALLVQQGRLDEASAHLGQALAVQPENAGFHHNLGVVYWEQGRFDDAAIHHRRALAIQPGYAAAHNCMGNILKVQGRFHDALFHYDRAIAARPDFAEAHFSRSELKTFRDGDADLAELEGLAASAGRPESQMTFFHFAAAKAWDDCGAYARAFEHFRAGNALRRRHIQYREEDQAALIRRIQAVFGRDLFDRLKGAGDPSACPVFVLGMPRSGSTLVEQILSSHPLIHGAGELNALDEAVRAESAFSGSAPDGAALGRIARHYLARLPAPRDGAVRIVDKMPDNFIHAGLIHLAFPNARIIHTVRNPLDTCWSCYSRLFTVGQPYSYDLGELGRFYRRYEELMDHWRSVLPADVMIDVRYEDVVADLEGQARRLIGFCGLPWDDRCLSFHRNSRTVKTASTVQVRQPLYRSSLERWRCYEKWLGPLIRELGKNGTDISSSPRHMRESFAHPGSRIACTV
jgi:Flp pilus assembly protein TadD